jgi:transposase
MAPLEAARASDIKAEMVAAVGDPRPFRSGRRYSSFFGLTPREYSSGDTRYLGRISRRGNRYVRMLLSHEARPVLRAATVARRAGRNVGTGQSRSQL